MLTETITPMPAAAGEKLYDLCMIERLCRGKQEQVQQMLHAFIAQVPAAVEEIKTAFVQKNAPVIKKAAHRIKPVLSFYAVIKIETEIKEIELQAAKGITDTQMAAQIEYVASVVEKVVGQMQQTLI